MPGGPGKTTETQEPQNPGLYQRGAATRQDDTDVQGPTGENLFRSYFVRRNSFPTITTALPRSSRRNRMRYAGKGKSERTRRSGVAAPETPSMEDNKSKTERRT